MKYITVILLAYFFVLFSVDRWYTFMADEELHKIQFQSEEKGAFSTRNWNFKQRYLSTDEQLGWIYLDRDKMNDAHTPENIELNKTYVVNLSKIQAHSWTDFFLLGTQYDYELESFFPGQKQAYEVDEIFAQAEEQQAGFMDYIWGVGFFIIFLLLLFILDQRVYGRIPVEEGFHKFNKPFIMELLSAFFYAIFGLLFIVGAKDYYQNDQLWSPLLFLFFSRALFYAAYRELKNRNDEILMNAEFFIFRNDGNEKKFSIDAIETIEMIQKENELEILFNYLDASAAPFKLQLKEMTNLYKFNAKIIEVAQQLYADKIKMTEEEA